MKIYLAIQRTWWLKVIFLHGNNCNISMLIFNAKCTTICICLYLFLKARLSSRNCNTHS